MEWSVLGYSGPTVLVIKTTADAVLGAFTVSPLKESKGFFGTSESFLFQLVPDLKVYRHTATDHKNFVYLHTGAGSHLSSLADHGIPKGLGFGGTLAMPRLFIPEYFERCTAGSYDMTFQSGDLLPLDAMEKFEIKCLEIWGVGGDDVITKALHDREKYRDLTANTIMRARMVQDKTAFAKDLESGLVPGSKLFSHQKDARGRPEFRVDDKHGGYTVESK
jgi:hypothetical protein